jgi:hypothetical protein
MSEREQLDIARVALRDISNATILPPVDQDDLTLLAERLIYVAVTAQRALVRTKPAAKG